MIRPGERWGEPAGRESAIAARGGDPELAKIARCHPGALVRFAPDEACDLARAVGLTKRSPGSWVLPVDVLDVGGRHAVNMLAVGIRPDRLRWWGRSWRVAVAVDGREVFDGLATSVVVANGQYLRGNDLVPRGHPGDGRIEVQVYALARGERSGMRQRLRTGTHVPHPGITSASGCEVEIRLDRAAAAEIDGRAVPVQDQWVVRVAPGALRLLV